MKLDIILMQILYFFTNRIDQQFHQANYFIFRPVPVFSGKCIKGKILNPQFGTALDYIADTFYSVKMSKQAIVPLFLGPTPIAVHNYGNVTRQFFSINFFK